MFALIHIITKFLFPHRCLVCRRVDFLLCPDCKQELKLDYNDPLPDTLTLYSYKNKIIKKLIWHLKFKYHEPVSTLFAPDLILATTYLFPEVQPQKIILIPIPTHSLNLKRRGYNQTLKLAEAIVAHDPEHFQLADVLIKIKKTKSQVECQTKRERLKNIKKSFTLKNSSLNLSAKHICLIDDVITTGATITEARRVLELSGFSNIKALALAHG